MPYLAFVRVIVTIPRAALDERFHVESKRVLERLLDLYTLHQPIVELEPWCVVSQKQVGIGVGRENREAGGGRGRG